MFGIGDLSNSDTQLPILVSYDAAFVQDVAQLGMTPLVEGPLQPHPGLDGDDST